MTVRGQRVSEYEYDLPEERIAQHPAERREESRLLHLDRSAGTIAHRTFRDIVEIPRAGDVFVLNDTRVIPARLIGTKPTGGGGEVLLLHPEGEGDRRWRALVRPGRRLKEGARLRVGDVLEVEVERVHPDGDRTVVLHTALPVDEAIDRCGRIPLPPYIDREPQGADLERYQTVYAAERGSVAAPTAGLHFTPPLLEGLRERGIGIERLTLHVGAGTFRPVETDDPAEHPMHSEWYALTDAAAERINAARRAGGAVWAVGTTTVRVLETVAEEDGSLHGRSGWTDLFIRPPYRFKAVDRLITNFHLPRSTLLMLVAAFAGYEPVLEAYRTAIAEGYRFYSFGDAMVVT